MSLLEKVLAFVPAGAFQRDALRWRLVTGPPEPRMLAEALLLDRTRQPDRRGPRHGRTPASASEASAGTAAGSHGVDMDLTLVSGAAPLLLRELPEGVAEGPRPFVLTG